MIDVHSREQCVIEYFDDFAFDEVLRHTGDLDERTRLMTQLAAMIAVGAVAEYRVTRPILARP